MNRLSRFYLKVLEKGTMYVIYRPTHELIGMLDRDDVDTLEFLMQCSTKEFARYIKINLMVDGFYRRTKGVLSSYSSINDAMMKNSEEWLKGAWENATYKHLEYLGIEGDIPEEDPQELLEAFKELVEEERRKENPLISEELEEKLNKALGSSIKQKMILRHLIKEVGSEKDPLIKEVKEWFESKKEPYKEEGGSAEKTPYKESTKGEVTDNKKKRVIKKKVIKKKK